jgi:hypothetical protein
MPDNMQKHFDRTTEDVGNIVHFEHVNLFVPDQIVATRFYISALGLTRDPYMMTGTDNMWVNAGRTQFHLPTGNPQRFRGTLNLVMPDRPALLARLTRMKPQLASTDFAFAEKDDHVAVTCPWGNSFRIYQPDPETFGLIELGIAQLDFDVPLGTAEPIAHFYNEIFEARSHVHRDGAAPAVAHVRVGDGQTFAFCETDKALVPYDGHHIQVYIADFSEPHRRLQAVGLVSEESSQHQFRFVDIADLSSGKTVFQIEHEIRSLTHPLCGRPLVNRNPNQTNMNYRRGHDAFR